MFEKTKGIVLNTVEFSDKASIANIYTETFGKLSFSLPASRSKKAALKRNLFQPMSILELEIDMRAGRNIQKIKEARPDITYESINYHPIKSAITLFIAEVLIRFIQEHEANSSLYAYIENSMLILDLSNEGTANFHLIFMYQLLNHLGISPKIEKVNQGYFVFDKGIVECRKPTHGAFLSEEQTSLLTHIAQYSFREMDKIKLSRQQRNLLTDALLCYLKYHLNNPTAFKSFEVLQTLFE